jgi:hypothetical protein
MLKAAFLAVISAAVCHAQTTQPKGSVSGTVVSTAGEPLKGATLRLQGQPPPNTSTTPPSPMQAYAASSDAQGNFTFEDLDPGRYTLSSERIGYLKRIIRRAQPAPSLSSISPPAKRLQASPSK